MPRGEGSGHAYRSTLLGVRNIYTKYEVTEARGGGVVAITILKILIELL
jgi:hypothetical protein